MLSPGHLALDKGAPRGKFGIPWNKQLWPAAATPESITTVYVCPGLRPFFSVVSVVIILSRTRAFCLLVPELCLSSFFLLVSSQGLSVLTTFLGLVFLLLRPVISASHVISDPGSLVFTLLDLAFTLPYTLVTRQKLRWFRSRHCVLHIHRCSCFLRAYLSIFLPATRTLLSFNTLFQTSGVIFNSIQSDKFPIVRTTRSSGVCLSVKVKNKNVDSTRLFVPTFSFFFSVR